MKLADLSSAVLDRIRGWDWDRIIEKHEGPWGWDITLKAHDVEFL